MSFPQKIQHSILFIVLMLFLTIELPIIAVGYLTKPEPGDTIIVLGAKLIGRDPSTMLRLRLDEAIKLYHQDYAGTIIVSGAQGADEDATEAAAMQTYLVNAGIPGERIIIEDKSYSTYQNLVNSQSIMRAYGLERAIIVSNASHMRRALVMAHNLGMQATGSPAPMANNTYLTAKQYVREGAAMVSLLVLNR